MSLIIFDCDGVLVDSEPISVAVLCEIVSEAGIELAEEVAYNRFLGRSMATIAHILEDEFGLVGAPTHLGQMRARLYQRLRSDLRPISNVTEMIEALRMPFCVASSSQPERIRLSLRVTDLLEKFEPHIYSSCMVNTGKPAPDLFLFAAHDMGVEPSECTVVEDSPAGIEAARRAGMRAFAFVGGSHMRSGALRSMLEALEPDVVFDDMTRLPGLLATTT